MLQHPVLAACLLAMLAAPAHAQVYRCGNAAVYTDKPCEGAEPVDLRPNLLEAGPRGMPAEDAPAAPVILKNTSKVVTGPEAGPSTIWQQKDSRDAGHTGRTTGPLR